MPRTAVLDTNVFVRALISETSWAARVFDAFLAGQFSLATSESILDEVRRTLSKPKVQVVIGLSPEEIDEFIVLIRGLALLTTDLYEVRAVEADPDDDKLLACALEADAQYLVTEDRQHLLALKEYRLLDYHVEIVDLARFVRLLGLSSQRCDPELPPTFADDFFAKGVANFVCTAWSVSDTAPVSYSPP
jgi:uncharacterized protein